MYALIPASSHHYDPLHFCGRRSSVPPSPPTRRSLQVASSSPTVALHWGRSLIFKCFGLDSSRDFNSRGGTLSQRTSKAFLHPSGAHSFHVQLHSFSLQNDLGPRNLTLRELGACRVLVYTDDFSSSRNIRTLRRHSNKNHSCVQTRAFNQQNGGGGGGDIGRTIFNLLGAGLLTYLTVTGRLNWLFDAIFSLWLVSAVLWWFAERSLIRGPCPNCGGDFQVFAFTAKEEPRLCPYCSQPFKLENKKFVRDEPQFSNQQAQGFQQPFGGFGGFDGFGQAKSSRKKEESSGGVIVDIEAEVRDKD